MLLKGDTMKPNERKAVGHTAGPWQALNGGPYVTTKIDPEGELVICVTANTVNQVGFAAKVASLEDQANARLIAQAPMLLTELERLVELIQDQDPRPSHEVEQYLAPARTAIARAKGVQ